LEQSSAVIPGDKIIYLTSQRYREQENIIGIVGF
jgi:hypothetical protein